MSLQDALHEDARCVDAVGVDGAGFDQVLDLGNRARRGGRHHRVEVARRTPIREVAVRVALPRFDECEICMQGGLEHVVPAVEIARLLAFCDQRAVAGRRVERGDPGAGRANALGERALRHQLDFDFLLQELPLELFVLADVGGDHLAHLARAQQQPDPRIVGPRVVADDGEVLRAALLKSGDEVFGNAGRDRSRPS